MANFYLILIAFNKVKFIMNYSSSRKFTSIFNLVRLITIIFISFNVYSAQGFLRFNSILNS